MQTHLDYGNWIRRRILLVLGACALGAGALALLPLGAAYQIVMAAVFAAALATFLIPLYSYAMFSQRGGQIQDKVYGLIVERLGPPAGGRLLDIGSGNGVLAVKLAQRNPAAEVVGVDYWGADWEYSKAVCERNARAGGVAARVRFQKGDAASLEFADGAFDGAVSNLTFHEVRTAPDKRAVVREALRVVRPGGRFAFVDYFYSEKLYGAPADFARSLRDLGLARVEVRPLRELLDLPLLLRHPRVLGRVGIVYGTR